MRTFTSTIITITALAACNKAEPEQPIVNVNIDVIVPEEPVEQTEPTEEPADPCEEQESFMVDNDLDGYGNPDVQISRSICDPLDLGFVPSVWNRIDCDDSNPLVNPAAAEICDGVIDNNCDGIDDANETDSDGDGFTICDPAPPVADPCDDPIVTVLNQLTLSPNVKGDTATLVQLLISAGRESVNLTDLTLTLASDDEPYSAPVDMIPDPTDHITQCSLVDSWGGVIAGPEPIDSSWEITFENFSELIYEDNVLNVRLDCVLANVDVVNDTDDGYTAFVADISDMTFEVALSGSAVLESDICLPNGLPNEDLASEATVLNNGTMSITHLPQPDTTLPLGHAGETRVIHETQWVAGFEDQRVEELSYTIEGDLDIIYYMQIVYTDENGALTGQSAPLPPSLTFYLNDFEVPEGDVHNVQLIASIYDDALPGQWIRATLHASQSEVRGNTSAEYIEGDDLISDTDIVGDDFTVTCAFDIEQDDGSLVEMENVLVVTASASTPAGAGFVPGYQELLRFNATAIYSQCPDVELNGFDLEVNWSNEAANPTYEPYDFEVYETADLSTVLAGPYALPNPAVTLNEVIPAGDTRTYSVYGDTTGASSFLDDAIQVQILDASLDWGAGSSVINDDESFEMNLSNPIGF